LVLNGPEKAALMQKNTRGIVVETILILDDSIAILGCIGDMLRFDHYSVLEASTGLQAIEISRKCGPLSLFVTDVQLPDGSGIDFALKLVALYPDLPVLVISGNPMDWWATRDVSNFSRFSPNKVDFLEKPFSISELQMRVRNLIGRRSQRNEAA
jgi:DNA-binding response OmpR family regulator